MHHYFEAQRGAFTISTDPSRLDLDVVADFLTRAYWAQGRPRAATERAYANSLVFGLYEGTRQIGVARVVSDLAVFAYLMDVFILEAYRGQGLGTWLLDIIFHQYPDLQHIRRWMLATNDAHALYAKFGFKVLDDASKWMDWIRPFAEEGQK